MDMPTNDDVMSAIKAQVANSDNKPTRVFFIDREGRLWGQSIGNSRCPRKLKKTLKKNGAYEDFMQRDIIGFNIENLNQK